MQEQTSSGNSAKNKSTIKYVLVVGNDADSLVYTSILLQRLDYQICTAFTIDEALDLAEVMVPSLVITDLKTPTLAAPHLIERLRKQPDTARVPIIIKSEHFTPELEKKCRDAGASVCLKKPVSAEDLYRAVQSTIEATPRERIRIRTQLSVIVNNRPLDEAAGEFATVLSSRGIYVRTRHPLPVKARFPTMVTIDERTIITEAKVISSHQEGQGPNGQPGMGLYFTDISDDDEKFLKRYIEAEVTKGMTSGRI
jgi:CheY-like chemotaxis protein